MFSTFKKWFGKKQGLKQEVHHPVLTLRGAGSGTTRTGAPVFRGPRTISDEVIGRVAKAIELEGLGAPNPVSLEKTNNSGLSPR